jgi:hypothetical protein
VSEPGEPDAHDWFGGVRPAEEARAPRPVGEAFGHRRKADEASASASDAESHWFAAHRGSAGAPVAVEKPAALAESAGVSAEVSAASGPVPELVTAFADAAGAAPSEPAPAEHSPVEPTPVEPTPTEPTPETDGRVRLQALTGGLADLSDALAAIGVQSVALRSNTPTRSAAASPDAPPPAADFRVRCPDCGPQFVAVADVRFVETGDGAEANRYLFTCPSCNARVRRPAGPELAEILKSSGVATLALRRGPGEAL